MKKVVITVLLLILCLVTAALSEPSLGKVHAQTATASGATTPSPTQMIRVSPIILKLRLDPGKTTSQVIKVDNLLEEPMPLRATVEGFDSNDEEFGFKISNQVQTSPLQSWIKIRQPDTIIPAKGSQEFTLDIQIPSKVNLGAYYAVIFFSPLFPNSQINSRVGVVTLANIGIQEMKNSAEVVTFDFKPNPFHGSTVPTTIRLKNTAANYFTARPTLNIKPLIGDAQTFELEDKTVLPGKVRRWQRDINLGELWSLFYTATLTVSLENGDKVTVTKTFLGFEMVKGILPLLGLGVLLWLIIKRKKVREALKVLFKG